MQYQLLKTRGALNEAQEDVDENIADWVSTSSAERGRSQYRPISLDSTRIPKSVLERIPSHMCWELHCIPFAEEGDRVFVATPDADDISLSDKLSFVINRDVRLVPAPKDQIHRALNRYYSSDDVESVDSLLNEFTEVALDFTCPTEVGFSPRASHLPNQSLNAIAARSGISAPRRDSTNRQSPAPLRPNSRQSTPRSGMFYYTIPDGTRALMTRVNGRMEILIGPRRVWKGSAEIHEMTQYIAHPGDYLIVRFRDGHQEHIIGPAEIWHDPRIHDRIELAEGLQIASKEAIVVYSHEGAVSGGARAQTTRRIVTGPDLFVPQPGEWLHTFSWHASKGGSTGVEKVPNGLVFQKLWLMPDQMYHDVHSVRTSDDAVLTVRLMLFFELVDIALMLDATHDPIGDFVNAATADVVEFTGRFDFEAFKKNTEKLNDLATYKQLASRARQIGYHIHNVVYRGYTAADSLQQMHNQAIEARTKLQLDRATEQQAQELESYRLESQLSRAAKRRSEQADEVRHDLELGQLRSQSELQIKQTQRDFVRDQQLADAKVKDTADRMSAAQQQAHLGTLREMGVDLTSYLTQHRADRVFEFRGQTAPHVHLDSMAPEPRHDQQSQK